MTDVYHGVEVADPYRWLEDGADEAVTRWSEEQNGYARTVLDSLDHLGAIRARVGQILEAPSVIYEKLALRPTGLFALKTQPPKQQPFLVLMPSVAKPEAARVLVDPSAIDASGTTAIDWVAPSHDGTLVAVSLSKGGTETGDLHIYDTATGRQVHEVIPRVNGGTAGGSVVWSPDGKGLFYTRYPRGEERPEEDRNFYVQVYYHELGTPTADDRYELGKGFPRIAEYELEIDPRSGRLLATVQKGDGGEFALHLRAPDGSWRQFSEFGDKIVQATFGTKDDLYVLTREGAPRGKLIRLDIQTLDVAKATTVIPESQDTIVQSFWDAPSILVTPGRLYVVYQLGGPSTIRVFDHQGKPAKTPEQLPVSAAGALTPLDGDDVLFENKSFVDPPAWFRFEALAGKTTRTGLVTSSPVDLSGVRVVREMATSKDGTKIPVNIVLPPGTELNGQNPCVVNGYGGYGVALSPRYRPHNGVLLEQGVIYAVANLRGGSEFGETWHRQGNLTNKQNVFDDFAAVLGHLIERRYTSSQRLGILGGSNGGLLMGATMVQHPELAQAVVSFVGIYDMLRVELSPNGAFNVTEFGTVKNPEHFKALHAYSPYHNVVDGTAYPTTLMLTGANDPRVDPLQSRKMTARLQAATSSDAPILLRISSDAGHGVDASLDERISQISDAYAFLVDALGVAYRPVAKP